MDTKKIFRNAMIDLMKEHSFEEITVQMILDQSTLSRSTFYRYYKDKYDLLNDYYQAGVISIFENEHYDSWEFYLKAIYTFMLDHFEYFRKALSVDCTNSFYDFLYEFSYDFVKKAYMKVKQTDTVDVKARIAIGYITKGQAHTLKMWIMHGAKESVEDMSHWAYELITDDYREILDSYCVKMQKQHQDEVKEVETEVGKNTARAV